MELLNVKLVVHIVTTELYSFKCITARCSYQVFPYTELTY